MKKKIGQDMGEWVLIIALIASVSIITWFTMAEKLKDIGVGLTSKLAQATQN